jgi:hypothetical protein
MIRFIGFVISDHFLEHQIMEDRNNVTEFLRTFYGQESPDPLLFIFLILLPGYLVGEFDHCDFYYMQSANHPAHVLLP